MQRIARALGTTDAAQGVFDLARDNGAPTALKDIGLKESDIDIALDIALKNPYWNPRRLNVRHCGLCWWPLTKGGDRTEYLWSQHARRPAQRDKRLKETSMDDHSSTALAVIS